MNIEVCFGLFFAAVKLQQSNTVAEVWFLNIMFDLKKMTHQIYKYFIKFTV